MSQYSVLIQYLPDRDGLNRAAPVILGTGALALAINVTYRIVKFVRRRKRENQLLKDFPGPTPHWLFGNLRQVSVFIASVRILLCATYVHKEKGDICWFLRIKIRKFRTLPWLSN